MSPLNNPPARRIGIACYPLIGGSGILASSLAMELARRGHEMHLFSYSKPVRLDVNVPRVHFHEVKVERTDVFRHREYAQPLAMRMAEVTRREGIELLHMHYAVPHAMAACLAAEMIGEGAPRIVTTLHGTDITLMESDPAYRSAIEHALEKSHAITAVSDSLRRQSYERLHIFKDIEVIPNFFAPAKPRRTRQEVRAELGLREQFLVLHMSNLRPVKRIDLLLRVIAGCRRRERIRLLILAGGDFEQYAAQVDDLGLRDQILVRRDESAVEDYLQAADAGLYTSELESFGLSILETLFHAKPVVAFRIGGIPEVVGDTGRLHEFGDVAAMSASLDELIAAPAAAHELGVRGQRRAVGQFTAERVVPMYESLYERVLA